MEVRIQIADEVYRRMLVSENWKSHTNLTHPVKVF